MIHCHHMRTGKASIETICINCPDCGEPYFDHKTGSEMITSDSGLKAGQKLWCGHCGNPFYAPALVNKL